MNATIHSATMEAARERNPERDHREEPTVRCPTCKQTLEPGQGGFRPFCSERCKLIDLGKWLDGSYAIPGEPASDEELAADLQTREDREPRRR